LVTRPVAGIAQLERSKRTKLRRFPSVDERTRRSGELPKFEFVRRRAPSTYASAIEEVTAQVVAAMLLAASYEVNRAGTTPSKAAEATAAAPSPPATTARTTGARRRDITAL
jgi:hypothetical protein